MALGRARAARAAGSPRTTTALLDGLVADERRADSAAAARHRHADGRRGRPAARSRGEALAFAGRARLASSTCARSPSCRSSASARAKQRLGDGARPGRARALAEAMVTRRARRAARASEGRRGRRRHRRAVARRRSPRPGGREVVARPRRGRPVAPPRSAASRAAIERGAERVLLVPGDCPALDPGERRRAARAPTRPPAVVDRPRPPRHGHERAAADAARARSRRRSAPGSRERHARAGARPRAPRRASEACRRSCSTSTRPTTSPRCAPRSPPRPGGAAHTRGCSSASRRR